MAHPNTLSNFYAKHLAVAEALFPDLDPETQQDIAERAASQEWEHQIGQAALKVAAGVRSGFLEAKSND